MVTPNAYCKILQRKSHLEKQRDEYSGELQQIEHILSNILTDRNYILEERFSVVLEKLIALNSRIDELNYVIQVIQDNTLYMEEINK